MILMEQIKYELKNGKGKGNFIENKSRDSYMKFEGE